MRAHHRRLTRIAAAVVCILAAASGAVAAQASAATLAASRACYVNVNPASGAAMTITGSGFVPDDVVTLRGGTTSATATADATGTVTFTTAAPKLRTNGPGAIRTTLTATDTGDATHPPFAVTIVVRSANLDMQVQPGSVKNVKKDTVTFSFSGFVPGKRIYGFYLRKKVVARAMFGRATGPCGVLTEKALLYPGGHPRNNEYTVTFESSRRYAKQGFPRVTGTLHILPL
ncbi:MAG: hypothetical protein WAL63_13455 [Solirubrobacteraceae bacterium]